MKDPKQATEVRVFQQGDQILSEGQECLLFFVILSGQVMLSGRGKKIRTLGEQDVFGLENLLLREQSHYSAEAVQESRVATYGPEALDHLIYENPRMVQNVLVSILHQLTQTTSNLLDHPEAIVADNGRICFYKDGETILDETSRRTDLYRLITTEGGLLVTESGRETSPIKNPGEFFGFPISCALTCVRSIGESVVEQYCTDDLDIMVRNYPESATQIMRMMIERLQSGTEA
ncbi:MAG TPA: Crp/Fnr family transcriptional regulator [Syntrophobacteraceae bacterium]|nr:Crp/Fnr family transcriptional regulator [Syntrophobacteraceae bacterium]